MEMQATPLVADRDSGLQPGSLTPASVEQRTLQGAWFGWWPWIASLGIFLLWVIGGILSQPGFFDEVVMREFIGRFGETIHRPQPLYFYLPHLLHKFAPWSVLMIAVAIADLHSRKWQLRSVFRDMSPETFWLLCWSMGGLIVMSLIPSKARRQNFSDCSAALSAFGCANSDRLR